MSIQRLENRLMNARLMTRLTDPKMASAMAAVATISNLSKDAVNCYYYVTQSLNNKKIPEDKRKFVAGLDLANGILNVVTQTAMATIVIKCSDKMYDKFFKKNYDEGAIKKISSGLKRISTETVEELISTRRNAAKAGLKLISALVATQIICKRVIVPLIATPMATYFRKEFEKREKKNNPNGAVQQDTVSFENSQKSNVQASSDAGNVKISNLPKCFQSFVE